ncbi:MAG: hypothetical protein ACO1OK_00295 [Devosia sp.]
MPLSPDMVAHIRRPYRHLAWMAWFERDGADLRVWSGAHTITHDGAAWLGYGYLATIDSLRRSNGLQHMELAFALNGLDPWIIADLDQSVRGRAARLWLAGIGDDRQVVREPLLLADLTQDTLGWSYGADGTVTLRLTCFEALPFLRRALKGKWSNESQLAAYPGDTGFAYNAPIALQGPAVEWTQP